MDISIPFFNDDAFKRRSNSHNGKFIVASPEQRLPEVRLLENIVVSDIEDGDFCLITSLSDTRLLKAMASDCVPIIVIDDQLKVDDLPFNKLLDWNSFSIIVRRHDLKQIVGIIEANERIADIKATLTSIYKRHFSSVKAIVDTTLEILRRRVAPHRIDVEQPHPLFYPSSLKTSSGFTAVILAFNRPESLIKVVNRVAEAPSLAKILVVWNNPDLEPPTLEGLSKPFRVLKTSHNALSNRFFPFDAIETECVLSLDDDIDMLTVDELEFGYATWREFPDRIVGFPPRTHFRDENGVYRYDSVWTNNVSMVLTGAAFYHEYWHHVYTAAADKSFKDIKEFVDRHMNCEDIAFNFLGRRIRRRPYGVPPRSI